MGKLGSVGRIFVFIVSGIVAIIVGSFMLRGNLHMWDRDKNKPPDDN
jgi:hypothetical protein